MKACIINYQQRDTRGESNDGEASEETVSGESSDDRNEADGAISDIKYLSSVDPLDVELLYQIHDQVPHPSGCRQCQPHQGTYVFNLYMTISPYIHTYIYIYIQKKKLTCDEGEGDPPAFSSAGGIGNLRLMVAGHCELGGAVGISQVCGRHVVDVVRFTDRR